MSVVGVDYGSKRIGIAVSSSLELATPHSILAHPGDEEGAAMRIAEVGSQLEAELYVLGVPRGIRHDSAAIESRFQRLAELIRQKSCTTVVLWDESHTSTEAASLREDRGRRRRRGAGDAIDHEAAAVMLQSWLDHQRRTS